MAASYRLETVRRQREQALEAARVELAARVEATARAAADAAAASARLSQAQTHFRERRSSASTLGHAVRGRDLTAAQAYLDRLAAVTAQREEALAEATVRLEQARAAERAAREAVLQAQRALEVVEKDKERFVRQQRRATERREEEASDDLVSFRYERGPDGSWGAIQ